MSNPHAIPDMLWLVLWRRKNAMGIQRDVYLTEGGAKRAIRKLRKSIELFDWVYHNPFPFERSTQVSSVAPKEDDR